MEVKNPTITHRAMPAAQQMIARRHTAFDGLRHASVIFQSATRASISSAAILGLRLMSGDPQFDQDKYHEDQAVETRRSKQASSSGGIRLDATQLRAVPSSPSNQTITPNPFDDAPSFRNLDRDDPFDDSKAIAELDQQTAFPYEQEQQYHVFTNKKKWFVVITIGFAGLFSGLSSNIYFPSLDAIAKDLGVSLGAVSLSITSYLIIQGISPVIWGAFSDTLGRRPIYIASFTVYIIANIVLSFTPNFAVLVIFRGLQAAGSASTVSIGNGVIQDICPPAERGAFISFYQAIRNFSIAIGPVLGGLLAQRFGFRSIFIFLTIISSIVIFVIIVFLPETMRSIAGDGTLRLNGIYQPLIRKIRKESPYMQDPEGTVKRKKVTIMTFIDPLKLLGERDILFNLVFGGVVYTIWSMVTASTTRLFKDPFKLTEGLLGLVFLPNGLGTIVGSAIVGKLMTQDYRAAETAYKAFRQLPFDYKLPAKHVPKDFPIEHARLRHLPWISTLFVAATAAYGFSLAFPEALAKPGWITVPLFFQFIIAATSNAIFSLNQTLVSDLCPGKGASATAINNLVRCGLGAVGVTFIDLMISSEGPALTFLGLALISIIVTPLTAVNWYWGPKWRAKRTTRTEKLESGEEARTVK